MTPPKSVNTQGALDTAPVRISVLRASNDLLLAFPSAVDSSASALRSQMHEVSNFVSAHAFVIVSGIPFAGCSQSRYMLSIPQFTESCIDFRLIKVLHIY